MKFRTLIAITTCALLAAVNLSAQQPTPRPRNGMRMQQPMHDSMFMAHMMSPAADARLDSLVQTMNRASGAGKVDAMAAVINQLLAERKIMREHMRHMMMKHGMEMGGEAPQPTPGAGRPNAAPKPVPADTAGHAEHHDP
jgi:hypothetical protein